MHEDLKHIIMFKPNCSYYQAYRPEVFLKLLFLKNKIDFELFFFLNFNVMNQTFIIILFVLYK